MDKYSIVMTVVLGSRALLRGITGRQRGNTPPKDLHSPRVCSDFPPGSVTQK